MDKNVKKVKDLLKKTKGFYSFLVGWLVSKSKKIDEESKRKKKSDPGLRAIFDRFGVDCWVSFASKIVKK